MRIRVLLFGPLQEAAGHSELSLDLSGQATAQSVTDEVVLRHPSLSALLKHVAFAVNSRYARREVELADGDVLALIPPVSGG